MSLVFFSCLCYVLGHVIGKKFVALPKPKYKFKVGDKVRFLSSKDSEIIRKLQRRGHKVTVKRGALTRGEIVAVKEDITGIHYTCAADLVMLTEVVNEKNIYKLI